MQNSNIAPVQARKPQNELLDRSIVEVIDKTHLSKRLAAGDKLRVKLGIDPTTADLHLGHIVPLRKLRQFQDAGHTAVLIIGDFTATIGDPSGRDKTRPSLSQSQVKANAKAFAKQAFRILNPDKTETRWQSEWFKDFNLDKLIQLTSKISTWHLLSHETFAKRKNAGHSLMHHETLYPLLQGYDSVVVKADVELGGTDQKFNLLTGRMVQQAYGQKPQDIILMPYLLGTDGKQKMSKSLGNTINLSDAPREMYGKVMSIPDDLILPYFELLTDLDSGALAKVKLQLKTKPRDAKAQLAFLLVESLFDRPQGKQAQDSFDSIFRRKAIPQNIKDVFVGLGRGSIADLMIASKLASSRQQALRLIQQGGVKVNGVKITDPDHDIIVNNIIIQVGKRQFARLVKG